MQFIPSPEAVSALSTLELNELRLTTILHNKKNMKCLSFKFSNGEISPFPGTYSTETDSETDISACDLASIKFNLWEYTK